MANKSVLEKLMAFSPHIEMMVRRIYYYLKPLLFIDLKARKASNLNKSNLDFSTILMKIKESGYEEGQILIVHSAFSSLKKFGLSPKELIDALIEFVGDNGTLAMPAIAIYPNETLKKELTSSELLKQKYKYDPNSLEIWTGALPKELISRPESFRSYHPLNSMVAIGAEAEMMMYQNEKDFYPNGEKSSWNYCAKRNAFIVGIGVDLTHSLTMIHVAEDILGEDNWYINNWYQDRTFIVSFPDGDKEVYVKERKHHWGRLHFGERNLANDLIKFGILKSVEIEEVLIESLNSKELINYLESKNRTGYPYFWVSNNLR